MWCSVQLTGMWSLNLLQHEPAVYVALFQVHWFSSHHPPPRIFTVNQSKHDRISSDMTCKENEWGLIELLTSRLSTMGFFLSVLVQSTSA